MHAVHQTTTINRVSEIQDIVDTIADKEGTALKSFLKGELALSKEMWQQLIDLKFRITMSQDEQITKHSWRKESMEGMQRHQKKKPI